MHHLYESNSSHEDEQGQPLVDAQIPPQHGHGEQGRGQDLQLVGHLVGGCVQVGEGDVQQVVLERVDPRGDRQLQRLHGLVQDLLLHHAIQGPHTEA